MAKNKENGSSEGSGSSGNTPRRPPETPKPKAVGKIVRDGQGYDD